MSAEEVEVVDEFEADAEDESDVVALAGAARSVSSVSVARLKTLVLRCWREGEGRGLCLGPENAAENTGIDGTAADADAAAALRRCSCFLLLAEEGAIAVVATRDRASDIAMAHAGEGNERAERSAFCAPSPRITRRWQPKEEQEKENGRASQSMVSLLRRSLALSTLSRRGAAAMASPPSPPVIVLSSDSDDGSEKQRAAARKRARKMSPSSTSDAAQPRPQPAAPPPRPPPPSAADTAAAAARGGGGGGDEEEDRTKASSPTKISFDRCDPLFTCGFALTATPNLELEQGFSKCNASVDRSARLSDLVTGAPRNALVSNFMIDPVWLFQSLPALRNVRGHLAIAMGDDRMVEATRQSLQVFASKECLSATVTRPPTEAFGTHHSKFFSLEYSWGVCVVVVRKGFFSFFFFRGEKERRTAEERNLKNSPSLSLSRFLVLSSSRSLSLARSLSLSRARSLALFSLPFFSR